MSWTKQRDLPVKLFVIEYLLIGYRYKAPAIELQGAFILRFRVFRFWFVGWNHVLVIIIQYFMGWSFQVVILARFDRPAQDVNSDSK